MITADNDGNLWITDVALHQVFKVDTKGNVLATLGKRLEPGTGTYFCKPTQVIPVQQACMGRLTA